MHQLHFLCQFFVQVLHHLVMKLEMLDDCDQIHQDHDLVHQVYFYQNLLAHQFYLVHQVFDYQNFLDHDLVHQVLAHLVLAQNFLDLDLVHQVLVHLGETLVLALNQVLLVLVHLSFQMDYFQVLALQVLVHLELMYHMDYFQVLEFAGEELVVFQFYLLKFVDLHFL